MKYTTLLAILVWGTVTGACSQAETSAGAAEGRPGENEASAAASSVVVPVQVVTAGEGSTAGEFVVTGTLDAVQQTPLTVKTGGIVKQLHVDVGDRVVQGQALATMDTDDRVLALKQAEAGYGIAEVAYAAAEKDYKRFSALEAGGTISKADHEKAELAYRAAKNQLKQAEAALAVTRNMVADAVVRAPFAGQITTRVVQLGGYVDPMMHPVMFVLVDSTRLKVTLNLPEMRAGLLKAGDDVVVRVPASERTFTTRVEVLTDTVDPMTRARTAIAWIDNPGPDPVPSGSYFEARLIPAALKGRILLPSAAVRADQAGATTVYVVSAGVAKRREIQGRFLADHADFIVESGLQKGEAVVAEASMVRDGQAVEAVGAAPARDEAAAAPARETLR